MAKKIVKLILKDIPELEIFYDNKEIEYLVISIKKQNKDFTIIDYYVDSWYNEKLIRTCINKIETAVQHLPKIWLRDSAVDSICHGANLNIPGISKLNNNINENDIVALMTLKDELIALGIASIKSSQIVEQEKGFAVKPTQVFMITGTYPKK